MEDNRNRFYLVSLSATIVVAIVLIFAILDYIQKGILIPVELWAVLGVCGAFITGLNIPFHINDKDKR